MKNKKLRPILIGAVILGVGVLGFAVLAALRTEPPKVQPPERRPVVTVVQPEGRQGALVVRGNGTVRPVRQVELVAEVPGKIVGLSEAMVSGGFFRQGQVLAQIDPADYDNAVAMAEAEVTQRQYELLLAEEEQAIAQDEWERLQQRAGAQEAPETAMGSLVLKEPQIKLARARLTSAEARLADATTRRARTRVTAPFNGRVEMKKADLGQYMAPGQPVASVYSTDALEVIVPLPSREAALLPALWTSEAQGRRARLPAAVVAEFGGQRYRWDGFVDRTEGTLDRGTRTFNVVVRVPQPYRSPDRPPLMVGAFTTVEIEGAALDRYFVLPRAALREGNVVWVVEDSTLTARPVEVVQEVEGEVYVQAGLEGGEQVVVSNLTTLTPGTPVRVATASERD